MRAFYSSELMQITQQRYGLQRFTKSLQIRFICQDFFKPTRQ